MNLTDDEKRELLEWLKSWYAGIVPSDKIYDRPGEDAYNKIRALITAPPPKHTMCENCLDDLEDENNKFAYDDKCWQKLCADYSKLLLERSIYSENKKLLDEIKKARPNVDEKFIEKWAKNLTELMTHIDHLPYDAKRKFLKAMLKEAGVSVEEK